MGILPIAAVRRGVGRYSEQSSKSAAIFFGLSARPGRNAGARGDIWWTNCSDIWPVNR
jgi:hypothetical protein